MGSRLAGVGRRIEDVLAYASVFLIVFLLILEVVVRKLFHTGVPNSTAYVRHLVLAATFIAASITSREKKHLSLAAAIPVREPFKSIVGTVAAALSASLVFGFMITSLSFSLTAFAPGETVGFLPKRVIGLVMVGGFLMMGFRFLVQMERKNLRIPAAALSVALGAFFAFAPLARLLGDLDPAWAPALTSAAGALQPLVAGLTAPLIVLLILTAFLGVPIFIVLGGIGFFLFSRLGLPLEIMPNQAYTVLTGNSIAAIPLFAIVGFLLSESQAGERLVKFFQAVFSWFPGGLIVMAVLVCAFFTTFTGASGVTILALGGLLSFILLDAGYSKRFSVGILTASGSVGLLFPPSLPVIIYGVIAQTSIKDMYIGGLVPGMVLALALAAAGIMFSVKRKIPRHPLQPKQALRSLAKSVWELLLPLVILVFYFGGITNLQESAAVAVLYALVVETLIKRDLKLKDLPKVLAKCIPVIGGVLIILALANGLSYYIIDAQIPTKLAAWVEGAIASKYVFLLLLNLALLVVGCFMDIYSAILVVVPLIIPLGNLYGIHPVHLGIIFLANLELGYLTPPVGLNLFLASYRFNEPMPKVYRDVLIFLGIMLGAVLLITYVPFLTTALLK